jgi:Uri superfamily endonuclease
LGLRNSACHGPSVRKNHQGVYTLIIRSVRPRGIMVGRRLSIVLERGSYLYTGSALGRGSTSLEWRLSRHMSREKKQFWHVDRILSSDSARLVSAIVARTRSRVECSVNTALLGDSDVRVLTKGVGSSDCRCESHFLAAKCGLYALQRKVISCYAGLGLDPYVLKGSGTYGPRVHGTRGAEVENHRNTDSNALIRS